MKRLVITGLSFLFVLTTAIALAQSSDGDFKITKSTIDSGGGISSHDDFSLTGTIGQFDANPQISKGGNFTLAGGFWANATVIDLIHKNGFESE